MSSFLDSTGLSRLASKITDYFAKKDGTYPDMTVGNVSSVANSRVSVDAVSGERWYKVADTAFDDTYGTRSGSWLITFASSETNKANITSLLLNVSLRTQNATKPYYVYSNGFCSGKLTDNAFGAKVVSRGVMGSGRKLELWVKCGADSSYRCSVLTKELAGRNYLLSKTKQFNYYDYQGVAGSAEPVTDESNNVYVYTPTIVYAPVGGKGSPSIPVYVASSGEVTACTPADMTVGNATTASDYNTSSGSINSEFNKRLYRTCSAVSHGVENTGNENYYKFASCYISNQYDNRNGTFLIVAVGERKENQVLALLKVNIRTFSKTDNVIASEVGAYLYVISDPFNNFKNNTFSVHYSVTNTWQSVLELWIGCNMRYGGVSVTELNSGIRQGISTSPWAYYSGAFTTLPSGSVTIAPLRLLSGLNSGVGSPSRPIYVNEYGAVATTTLVTSGSAIDTNTTLPNGTGLGNGAMVNVCNVSGSAITVSYNSSTVGTVAAGKVGCFVWYNSAWHKHAFE